MKNELLFITIGLALLGTPIINAEFSFIAKWGSKGNGNGEFSAPTSIAVDSSDNFYIADTFNHRIQKFTLVSHFAVCFGGEGVVMGNPHKICFSKKWGSKGSGSGKLDGPRGIAVSGNDVYVADSANSRIQKFSSIGEPLDVWVQGSNNVNLNFPTAVAVDSSGIVYVADTFNHRIQKFGIDGFPLYAWGSQGSGDGQFEGPRGIAVDSSDNVYVADNGNHRI